MTEFASPMMHVIHFGATVEIIRELRIHAEQQFYEVLEFDFSEVVDIYTLVQLLQSRLWFPHETQSLDAIADLMSDLQWLPAQRGYLMVVAGVPLELEGMSAFLSILPNVLDRWRAQGVPFVVAVEEWRPQAALVLCEANELMEQAGKLAWAQPGTGPVPVMVHCSL